MINFLLTFCLSVMAHEGPHGPKQEVAPHGGILRDGPTLMLELVKSQDKIKIYPLKHDGSNIDLKQIVADEKKSSLTDSKKKPVPFKLISGGEGIELQFEKGSSHRYSFVLVAKFEGHENKAQWQIELGAE